MRLLSNAQYDDLLMRVHRAESARDLYELAARDADARYQALVDRYVTAGVPVGTVVAPAPEASTPLPSDVIAALDEFRSDGELYAYNTRWAETALAGGAAPDVVAHTIRFGQSADDYAMAVLS